MRNREPGVVLTSVHGWVGGGLSSRKIFNRTRAARRRSIIALGTPRPDLHVAVCSQVFARLRADGDAEVAEGLAAYWQVARQHRCSAFRRGGGAASEFDRWLVKAGAHFARSASPKSYVGFVLAIESLQIFDEKDAIPVSASDLAVAIDRLVETAAPTPADAELIEAVTFAVLDRVEAMAHALLMMPPPAAN